MSKTLDKKLNEIQLFEALRNALGHFEEPNTVYSSEFIDPDTGLVFTSTIDLLNSLHELGIEGKNLKETGLNLEEWYELLKNQTETITETPRPTGPEATTLTSEQFENFDKDVERIKESEKIRANQKNVTEQFEKRNKEILAEQQKIQDRILKSKAAEPEIAKIKDWEIKVDEIEKVQLKPQEKTVFDEFKKQIQEASIISDETKKTEELNQIKIDLAREIHARAESVLKAQGLEKEELDFVVIKTSERIIEEIQASESPKYLPPMAQLAIHAAVLEKIQTIPTAVISTKAKEVLLSSIGTTIKFRILPDVYLENVTKVAFGPEFSRVIFGSKYNVSISELPTQGYVYSFNFSKANEDGRQIQSQQNQTLETLKGLGQNEARTFLLDNTAAYFAKSPVGTKILASKKAQVAFYSVFKGAGQTVTWEGVGIGRYAIGTGYENVIYLATGNKYVTPTISATSGAIGYNLAARAAAQATAEVTFTGGIMAGEAFAGGAGQALATQTAVKTGLGSLIAKIATVIGIGTGPVTFGLSAAVGWIVGKVIEKLPQIKRWISENGWTLGVIAGVGGAMIFGTGPGLGIGIIVTGAAVGFGTLATRTFGVLGLIGRSVGITIATPVIITLLVIPPLVAFIMLVINNSAYVVPPAPPSSNGSEVITSPYIDIIKTPNPPGPFENSDLPLTVDYTVEIKAKKGNLSNVTINYECIVLKKNGSAVCPKSEPEIPTTVENGISPTSSFKFSYKHTYNTLNYSDSFVTDTITVNADAVEQEGITAAGSATIKIGEPPEDCPSIWPTSHGYITQGAYTPTSCGNNCSHGTTESIDIGVSNTGVVATHTGTVVMAERDSCYGNRVRIKSNCNGKDFISQYAHLEGVSVRNGQLVTMGQNIGLSGNTGSCTTGPHLHYEFRYYPDGKPSFPNNPPFMNNPYVPSNIKRGCKTTAECGVSF